jgi:hypothetical protein
LAVFNYIISVDVSLVGGDSYMFIYDRSMKYIVAPLEEFPLIFFQIEGIIA